MKDGDDGCRKVGVALDYKVTRERGQKHETIVIKLQDIQHQVPQYLSREFFVWVCGLLRSILC